VPRFNRKSESLSTFQFLNSAAGEQWTRARDLLDSWYSDYPDPHKDKLRNHFRSELEGQHVGAWWELYTFTLHRRLGYSVTVEPELPGSTKKIDFLVSRGNESMYIECAVDGAEDGPITSNPAAGSRLPGGQARPRSSPVPTSGVGEHTNPEICGLTCGKVELAGLGRVTTRSG